jgi:hypothetical protein
MMSISSYRFWPRHLAEPQNLRRLEFLGGCVGELAQAQLVKALPGHADEVLVEPVVVEARPSRDLFDFVQQTGFEGRFAVPGEADQAEW